MYGKVKSVWKSDTFPDTFCIEKLSFLTMHKKKYLHLMKIYTQLNSQDTRMKISNIDSLDTHKQLP